MRFFRKQPDFDDLLLNIKDETAKAMLLSRYLQAELAHSWLRETGLKFDVQDVISLLQIISGNNSKADYT